MTTAARAPDLHEPAWEIARIFPPQGLWSEEEYISLTNTTNHLIEFDNGYIEVLPMPTSRHQRILGLLYRLMYSFVSTHNLGTVLVAALRVQVMTGKFREPDIVFLSTEHAAWDQEQFFAGADLVLEIVSPDDPKRDLLTKRAEYAASGFPEYWIVNPLDETITVLWLSGDAYAEHGVFQRGDTATSLLLKGFSVPVHAVFEAR